MGMYAGKHDLKIDCATGRFGELSKSVMYKGDDPAFGVCGYVCWDENQPAYGKRGRVRDTPEPKPIS